MGNLLMVLGALFVGIFIMVNIAKWTSNNSKNDNTDNPILQKLYRWIPALLITSLVLQLLYHWIGP